MHTRTKRASFLAIAVLAALPLISMGWPTSSWATGARSGHASAAPSCGETLSTGEVPGSYGGSVCITGPVWLDHPDVFGSVVIEKGGAFSIGYPPDESTPSDCGTPWNWNGKATVTGSLTVAAGGSLLLNSSVTCSDGGSSELDTRGGIVNEGTVIAATSGGAGQAKWAIGGQRTLGGGFVNRGKVEVDAPLALVGPGTFQNQGTIIVGTYAAPQGQLSQTLTVPPPPGGGGALTFVNGPGGSIDLLVWHSGTQYVSGSFTLDAPNTFTQAGGKTKGAPVFDNGGALSYKGTGASTIGITGSAAISGTIPAGSVLALSDPHGGGSETCGGALVVDAAPSGLTVAKGATLIGYGSSPCSSGSATTLKIGAGKSLVNNGTLIAGSCGNASTLLPGAYGAPNVFCIAGENIFQGRVLNNGKLTIAAGVTMSFSNLANYQASTHKLKGGSYFTKGGTLQVAGVTVAAPH